MKNGIPLGRLISGDGYSILNNRSIHAFLSSVCHASGEAGDIPESVVNTPIQSCHLLLALETLAQYFLFEVRFVLFLDGYILSTI